MDLRDAHALAVRLMHEHGLDDWSLAYDNAKTRAGICRHGRNEISLSRHLTALHPVAEVTDTILHEIAHALAGPGHGHDDVWRGIARRIGCSATRCVSADAPKVEGAWVGTCPAGHTRTRHRRPVRVGSCPACSPGRFDPHAILTWTHRSRPGVPAPMHPNYVLELEQIRKAQTSDTRTGGPSAGDSLLGLAVGTPVRVAGSGKYAGLTGTIERRGRTRYRVRTAQGPLLAPFALVQPLGLDAAGERS